MANSYFTPCCMHALGIGGLFAYWNIFRKNVISFFTKFYWVVLSVVLYFAFHYISFFENWDWEKVTIDDFLFACMSVLIINYAAHNKFKSVFQYILENKFVVYSGKISYGLYVFHLFIPGFFWDHLSPLIGLNTSNKYTTFVVFYLTTFIMAHISWKLMENPINNLKRYFPYIKEKQ